MTTEMPGVDPTQQVPPVGEQPAERSRPAVPRLPAPALIPIAAVVWWVVGFLPWILDGLGGSILGRIGVSRTAVPLFAGNVSALAIGGGLGGVAAGLVVLLGRDGRARSALAVAAGVAIALVVTVVQSRGVLSGTADGRFDSDPRVLNGLTAGLVAMTVLGLMLGLLALTGPVGLGVALAAVAGAAPVWTSSVLDQVGLFGPGSYDHAATLVRWVGAAFLVAALVAIGLRPALRLVGWPVAIVLAWIVGPSVTAAAYIEPLLRPGMGLPDMLGDHISASLEVWRMAASFEARPLTPWVVAIIAAAGIAFARSQMTTDGRTTEALPT